jgi:carbonic anhydrase/acetyltransferase-like protein (isoleucine patch superfamily)
MPLKNKRYVWNNDEVAECPTVNDRLILPGGCNINRGNLSIIYDGAVIHDSCIIGAGSIVESNTMIGYQTILAPNVSVSDWVAIGARVRIGEGSMIGVGVILSDEVRIGTKSDIHSNVSVGRGSLIGDACVIDQGSTIGKQVVIRNRAIIGAWSKIADGVRLGSRINLAQDSHIMSTPLSIQGPHHLVTLVSLTDIQIGSEVLDFTGWNDPSRSQIFKRLGIDGEWVKAYVDILNFLEDYASDFGHLIFGH